MLVIYFVEGLRGDGCLGGGEFGLQEGEEEGVFGGVGSRGGGVDGQGEQFRGGEVREEVTGGAVFDGVPGRGGGG